MSFGWFACIYGIGYVVSSVVAGISTCVYLGRRFGACWPDRVGVVASGDGGVRCAYSLLSVVRTVLLWPVMIPYNVIRLVRECKARYEK